MKLVQIIAASFALLAATSGLAYDKPVEKKIFSLPAYTTVGGKTIKDVKVSYETYGTLNAAGNNAVFVPVASDLVFPPEFSQKAAAKFRAQGGTAEVFVLEGDRGHLDGVIGIGKAADAIRAFMSK